ncbi:MAG: glycosyltransferase family 2 protein [Anaerolineales bacterium]
MSVIIPIHQGRATVLQTALTSISRQPLGLSECVEVIVVQDGEDDGGDEVTKRFRDLNIKYLSSNASHGISASRNRGIQVAEAPLVLLLDSDDFLVESCVEQILSFAKDEPSNDFYYSNSQRFYECQGFSLAFPSFLTFAIACMRNVEGHGSTLSSARYLLGMRLQLGGSC